LTLGHLDEWRVNPLPVYKAAKSMLGIAILWLLCAAVRLELADRAPTID